METLIKIRFHWQRPVLLALFVVTALAVAMCGLQKLDNGGLQKVVVKDRRYQKQIALIQSHLK